MSRPILPLAVAYLVLTIFSSCSETDSSQSLVITGSSIVAPVVADAAQRFEKENPDVRIDVQTGGSSRGINDVRNSLAIIGMASRPLKPDESDLQSQTIAMDGVCLIVHQDNPISGLTREEISEIYQKEHSNWRQFGGNDAKIVVASKASGRATLEVFLDYTGLDSSDIQADVILGENQQQRLCIARALALDPQVILFDEPCSALDPLASAIVEDHIAALRGKVTVIIVTHNLAQAHRISDSTAIFWIRDGAGTIVEHGPTKTIFGGATDPDAAHYLSGERG